GLAKLASPERDPDREGQADLGLTQTGALMGTAGYMSPEQVRGEKTDGRSDLFSLGAVLYEMISGRKPFSAPTLPEAMTATLNDDPPPLPNHPALERIVLHCLEKRPEDRYQSARDLAFALEGVTETPAATAPGARRRRLAWLALPALLGALVLG